MAKLSPQPQILAKMSVAKLSVAKLSYIQILLSVITCRLLLKSYMYT